MSLPLRIGIDYTAAVRQSAGIGRYTRNLIRAVAELDQESRYTLFAAGGWGGGDGLGAWPSNFRIRSLPLSERLVRILWHRLRLPIPVQVVTGAIDLFHSPDFVLPLCGSAPSLLTVHDLSFLRTPQFFVPEFRRYLTSAVSRSVNRASHILVDSKSSRNDLIECLNVSPERITVLYPAVEPRFQPVRDRGLLERVRSRYELPERFVLGLSTLQPRKNFEGLVDGFRRLLGLLDTSQGEETGGRPQLVIAGSKGWMFEEMSKQVVRQGLENQVRFVGFVDDDDLPGLYSLAEVFAFPSWYEGFGLPVIEAMACGTPVVAADNSSLPEAVGDAGLMVDAADHEALAQALHLVLTRDELRASLVGAGLAQASRFRWDGAADQLLDVYRSVAARRAGHVSSNSGRLDRTGGSQDGFGGNDFA